MCAPILDMKPNLCAAVKGTEKTVLAILSEGLLSLRSAPSQLPLCHGDKTCEWEISGGSVACLQPTKAAG